MRAANALVRLCICANSPKPSLLTSAISTDKFLQIIYNLKIKFSLFLVLLHVCTHVG